MAELTIKVTPFGWRDDGSFSTSWDRAFRSLDDTSIGEFREQDIAEVLYEGETGDTWDGKCAAVFKLNDGRLVAYETFYGPTGDGFHEDAYGGDAELVFASDLRLLVNEALTDEGRRLAGVPEELWND
jgi:hypothetical protein